MAAEKVPTTMRAWQYSSTKGGMEQNLHLNPSVRVPQPKPNEHLVRVIAVALNPVDYKVVDIALVHRLVMPKPATPGLDFVGRIVRPAAQSSLKEGQLIFGASSASFAVGFALADFAAVPIDRTTVVPEGLAIADAASISMAGTTSWQSIVPYIKSGSRIFINGGSGGVGSFGIQFAKAKGAHVTVSCSTANVQICKSLGADEVVDYKQSPLISQLQSLAQSDKAFDVVIDNIGADFDLYWKMPTFTSPPATYVFVGSSPGFYLISFALRAKLLPGFLGGGKRKLEMLVTQRSVEQLDQIAQSIVEGKTKSVVGSTYTMDQVIEAYQKQRSGRAVGKIIVEVNPEMA